MPKHWNRPRPNVAVMHALGIVNRWMFLRGLPVLREIPVIRDLPLVHGYFWVRSLDIPDADLQRLRKAVNRDTVAFLGPNHPEFGTDWMIDKEISTLVSPRMASWADRGIVAAAPRFWGMNNLVANDGGDDARDYSVEWALKGEGVLLHPEGSVRWTGNTVHGLFPGIAQMAIAAAARTTSPVFIVPVVWKYRYVDDVSDRIHREMSILEHDLGVSRAATRNLAERFEALQEHILATQMKRFAYDAVHDAGLFDRQSAFQRWLVDGLERRFSTEPSDDMDKRIARLSRVIRHERSADGADRVALKHDLAMAEEAKRLGEFARESYGTETLSQEQLFESLKRSRDRLFKRHWKDALSNTLPRPFGPRVVHVGVPEPVRVSATSVEAELLERTRHRMQASLDEINARIADDVARFSVPNPFFG